jgi:hypothetical protein
MFIWIARSLQFVARRRGVFSTSPLQYPLCPWHITSLSALTEIVVGPDGGQLLGHGHVDELIQCDAFGLGDPAHFVQQRSLQTQRYVTPSHIAVVPPADVGPGFHPAAGF